jgi:hypothetical protein
VVGGDDSLPPDSTFTTLRAKAVNLTSPSEVDTEVIAWLTVAYDYAG